MVSTSPNGDQIRRLTELLLWNLANQRGRPQVSRVIHSRKDPRWIPDFHLPVWLCFALSLLVSCQRGATVAAPLPQRAYVWQREWNKNVVGAIARSRDDLAGVVVLACEIEWREGRPTSVVPPVDWAAVKAGKFSLSPAIRVMPYPGPFSSDDEICRYLCETARARLSDIRAAGVEPRELQLDFDCAQKKLAGYARWVREVRREIAPLPLVITTLPSWLDEPEFPDLVRSAGGYVLQVHSVSPPAEGGEVKVCDPALARKRVARASGIGVPFEISLPTYRMIAGYDENGRKIGAYSDAVRPAWPPGTTIREYATDLDAMASLVAGWQARHPDHCTGLMWYRLPVDGDRQNCPWPAFRAMTQGRAPARSCEIRVNGGSGNDREATALADLTLVNTGESEDFPLSGICVKWEGPAELSMAEPSAGWRLVREDHEVTFFAPRPSARLPLDAVRAMGWLRFDQPAPIHAEALREDR